MAHRPTLTLRCGPGPHLDGDGEVVRRQPDSLEGQHSLFSCYYRSNRWDEAVEVATEAVRRLEADRFLMDALGLELARAYLAVRRAEAEALGGLSLEDEVGMLLERY